MKRDSVDSLEAIEAMMALEEALEGALPKSIPELEPYLVTPVEAPCTKGGFSIPVWIVARHRSTVLIASRESVRFGVGVLDTK